MAQHADKIAHLCAEFLHFFQRKKENYALTLSDSLDIADHLNSYPQKQQSIELIFIDI